MDFGKVAPDLLGAINFELPPDPPQNQGVLGIDPTKKRKIYTGLNMWGHRPWVGKLFALGTPPQQLLRRYAAQYNVVELNATHYNIYPPAHMAGWRKAVGQHAFQFCPKMYQGITHDGGLLNKGPLLHHFFDSVLALEHLLGPIFIQFSDAVGPDRQTELLAFLGSLPTGFQFFVELRHPQWFLPEHAEPWFAQLKQLGIGAVITDSSGRRDVIHMHLTGKTAFVRFVGNSLHATDFYRVQQWADRLNHWFNQGLETAYFFVHMHNEDCSPELTQHVARIFSETCGVPIQMPKFVERQGSLF